MTCALFMSRNDEVEVSRVVDGVEDGKDSTSWVAKDLFYAVAEHHFMENLTARKADKRVIHGGGGALLELRNIAGIGMGYLLKCRRWCRPPDHTEVSTRASAVPGMGQRRTRTAQGQAEQLLTLNLRRYVMICAREHGAWPRQWKKSARSQMLIGAGTRCLFEFELQPGTTGHGTQVWGAWEA